MASSLDEAVAREIQRRRGAGVPLPGGVREQMEGAFGTDFSHVRVHTGSDAQELSQKVRARAFTVGRDIFLSRDATVSASPSGRKLLAHELTHVLQQSGTGGGTPNAVSDPSAASERQAEIAASQVHRGPRTAGRGSTVRPAAAQLNPHSVQRCGDVAPADCRCNGASTPEGPSPAFDEDELVLPPSADSVQRQTLPVTPSGGQTSEAPSRGVEPLAGLLTEADATDLQPNQMKKSEFLDRLHAAICYDLAVALASVGRSTDGCPYLKVLFSHYRRQSAAEVERVLHRYAPEARSAGSASELIQVVLPRVRGPVEHWVNTGEVTGVPEDAPLPVSALLAAAEAGEDEEFAGAAVQRKTRAGAGRASQHPAAVLARLGPGRPLDQPVRHRMETVFGTSFDGVRIHTDIAAGHMSGQQDARAFTVGRHMAFAAGEYRPGTPVGDALIAHELAHVVQQSGADRSVPRFDDHAAESPALEADADRSGMSAVASLWLRAGDTARAVARNVMPAVRSGLQLQRCRKSEKYKKRPHEYHGVGGWLHASVFEPLQEDYAGWVRWGSNLASEWGEEVPVVGHVAGSAVGFVPWVLGTAGQGVVSVPQFVTPKSEEEHFLFVVSGGTAPAAVRAGKSAQYGSWWVRNLFKKKPKLEQQLLELGTHTVDDVARDAARRAPARTRDIPARKAPARDQGRAGGRGRVSSQEFFKTASFQELVEFVGGEHHLRKLSSQLHAAIGSDVGRNRRVIAIGVVREGPGHPPRLNYTASGNRVGGPVERAAADLGVEPLRMPDSVLRAKGRASRRHPHAPGAPGDAEQRMIEAIEQSGMELIAVVPSKKACPDCVAALAVEGAILINP